MIGPVPASTPVPAIVRPAAIPDVSALIPQALNRVRSYRGATFAGAVLDEVDGSTAGATGTRTAAGIVSWTFVFATGNSTDPTARLNYNAKGFATIGVSTQVTLEDATITKVPKLTLAAAVARLDATGHTGAFTGVTLRQPIYPGDVHPFYIFTFKSGYIAVDDTTGKVENFS